jgi:hypothetical protein
MDRAPAGDWQRKTDKKAVMIAVVANLLNLFMFSFL